MLMLQRIRYNIIQLLLKWNRTWHSACIGIRARWWCWQIIVELLLVAMIKGTVQICKLAKWFFTWKWNKIFKVVVFDKISTVFVVKSSLVGKFKKYFFITIFHTKKMVENNSRNLIKKNALNVIWFRLISMHHHHDNNIQQVCMYVLRRKGNQ